MNNYAYEITEIAEPSYEIPPLPAEGLRFTFPFVLVSVLTGVISLVFYFSLGKIAALVPMGIWATLLVLVSPRAGVVLALALQVWDVALNPTQAGAYAWLSPGRILPIICLLAYLRFLVGRRPSVKSVKRSIRLFFVFVFWGFCLIIVAQSKSTAIVAVLKVFIQVSLLLVAVDLVSGRKLLEQTLFLMAIGAVTGGLYALFGGIAVRAVAGERLVLPGLQINALADSVGLAIVAMMALLTLRRSVITIPVVIFGIIGLSLAALRMGTRAIVIGVPLAIMSGMLLGYWKRIHKLFIFGILIAVLLGGSLYWALQTGFITGYLRERVLGTFAGQTYRENVRMELWQNAFRIYLKKPQGAGPGNEPLAYSIYSQTKALESHTVFLSVLVEYNVVGLAIFMAGFSALGIAVLRIKDPALRCAAGMIFAYCFLIALATSILETRFFWQPIMLVMMIVETDFRTRQSPLVSYEGETMESFETLYENQMV